MNECSTWGRRALLSVLSALIIVLPGCSMLTPQQRDNVKAQLQDDYAAGNITLAQRDAAIQALDSDKPFDWATLGVVGANIALALVGGPMIVRLQRGQPTQKVGLPASLVKPSGGAA